MAKEKILYHKGRQVSFVSLVNFFVYFVVKKQVH